MVDNKKVIVVTPAGRQRYMELLQHFIVNNPIIDEWHIWQHTNHAPDIAYFGRLRTQHKKIKIIKINETFESIKIHKFLCNCTEKNTVYVRIDDDVIWMENNSIENLVRYRLDNKNPFIIYGNIINNSICDFIHQKTGSLICEKPIGYACMDPVGWNDCYIAEQKHHNFLEKFAKNNLNDFKFNKWILSGYERCSVNVICWTGEDFAFFHGKVPQDEEQWLSVEGPKQYGRPNEICGQTIFCHFSFYTQRAHLDSTNILKLYKKIIDPHGRLFQEKTKFFL